MLTERIEEALAAQTAAGPEAERFAVFFLDLDHFKEVNDTFGHRYGDLVLQETARRLASAVPETATLVRLSGDEFGVVLPRTDARRAAEVAQDLLDTLERPLPLREVTVDLSASLGIALAPEDGGDADQLQRCADVAMYAAKSRRRTFA